MSEWQREKLVWDPVYLDKICAIALQYIQENTYWRLNEDGEPFPEGVDLFQSGDMLFKEVSAVGGVIIFRVPYAEHTNAKWKWAAIPPQRLEEFYQEIQPLVDAGLSNVPA